MKRPEQSINDITTDSFHLLESNAYCLKPNRQHKSTSFSGDSQVHQDFHGLF